MKNAMLSVLFLLAVLGGIEMTSAQTSWVYIGGYGSEPNEAMKKLGVGKLRGIYRAEYDAAAGKLTGLTLAAEIESPGFFSYSPKTKTLYTCCGGKENLAAFRVDPADGSLTLLNRVSNGGPGCCHVEVSPDGDFLVSANYTGGSFAVNRVLPDGSLGEVTESIVKPGSGPDAKRQDSPKGHAGYFVPDGDITRVLLVDLGTDRVFIERLNPVTGKLSDDPDIPALSLPGGAGCRHLAWHKNADGSLDVFVNNELDSTVSFFTLEFGKGSDGLTYWGTWLTVPEEFRGKVSWDQSAVDADEALTLMNSTAETMYREPVGENPPVVYVSNRGHNSIAVFQVVEKSGIRALKPIQYEPTGGDSPRYFCFDKEQKHLLAENKRTGTIVTFHLADDGRMTPTGFEPLKIGWPCAMIIIEK